MAEGKFDNSVSLICWAYNEEENIAEYLQRAFALLDSAVEDYEIVLVDDGSADRTYEIARGFQERNPQLNIIRHEKNKDVGSAFRTALKSATKEYLFWQTVDWSYDISSLRAYLELLKKYDIVAGVRRKPVNVKLKYMKPVASLVKLFGIKHLTKRSDTIGKALVSVINYTLIRILFRLPLSDYQNVCFYPTKWIQGIEYEANSSMVNPEGLIKSYWNGMSIVEVPINFIPRTKGTAKGTRLASIKRSVKDVFRLWFRWVVLGKRNLTKYGAVHRNERID